MPVKPVSDWAGNYWSYAYGWGLPSFAIIMGALTSEPSRTLIWSIALAWMGIACPVYENETVAQTSSTQLPMYFRTGWRPCWAMLHVFQYSYPRVPKRAHKWWRLYLITMGLRTLISLTTASRLLNKASSHELKITVSANQSSVRAIPRPSIVSSTHHSGTLCTTHLATWYWIDLRTWKAIEGCCV